jgi:hypothetical protein
MPLPTFARRLLVLPCLFIMLPSCYNYRINTHAQQGAEATSRNVSSFFWGLMQNPKQITTPNCDSLGVNGMAEVRVKTNLGYSLITVATLGIWSPMKVEWRCSKPCPKVDPL